MGAVRYAVQPEIVLGSTMQLSLPTEGVPEIAIHYSKKRVLATIRQPEDVVQFIRSLYPRERLDVQEHFVVLYLNNVNEVIGYYKHTIGGIRAVVVDIRIILAVALKSLSTGIIVSHNHPSGNTQPSSEDKRLTSRLREAVAAMEITLLDHVIITQSNHFSFANEGLLGTSLNGFGRISPKADTALCQI
jgi:DNA repair protein RadC